MKKTVRNSLVLVLLLVCWLLNNKSVHASYIVMNASTIKLQVGQTSTALKAKPKPSTDTVKSWKSSKPKVVTVNKSTGELKAKKEGTATITVTLESGVKAKCKVTVQKSQVKTTSLTLPLKRIIMRKKETQKISYTRLPITANDGKITYKSNNPKIAKVNKKGKITALNKGKVTITVKAGSKTQKMTVTVI